MLKIEHFHLSASLNGTPYSSHHCKNATRERIVYIWSDCMRTGLYAFIIVCDASSKDPINTYRTETVKDIDTVLRDINSILADLHKTGVFTDERYSLCTEG